MASVHTSNPVHDELINNFDTFIDQLDYLQKQIQDTGFADEFAKASGANSRANNFEIRGFDLHGITIGCEYNDSCGCHPEYQTDIFTIPWETVHDALINYEETFAKLKTRNDERLRFEQERREREERLRAQAQQAKERAEYERLQKKFSV